MNTSVFLQCLAATGFTTGTQLIGVYSFNSGTPSFVYNQLFPTGFNVYSGYPFESAMPCLFEGTGNNPSGNFNGNSPYQIGDSFTSDFGILIMLQNSGCLHTGNQNYLMISTLSNPNNNSGVICGLTPSNRLFITVSGFSTTLPNEVDVGDSIFLSVQQNRYVNYGNFSLKDQTFYGQSIDYGSPGIAVQNLFIGGALSYPSYTTGYSGTMSQIVLFNGNIPNSLFNGCINCAFATGYGYTVVSSTFYDTLITGSVWTGIYNNQITGYTIVSGTYPKIGGEGILYYDSGVSGNILLYQSLQPLTTGVPYTVYTSGLSFIYNTGQILSGLVSNVYFPIGLSSGDVVEIYSYQLPVPSLGIPLAYNGKYPTSNQFVQLYGNGLAETLDVDFYLTYGNNINGYDSNDVLLYDVIPSAITMPYITGYLLTGTPTSTYTLITGISGVNMANFNYDIYLNGQKVISGVNYNYTSPYLYVSGNDLADINDPSDAPELKLIPQFPYLMRNLFEITGNANTIGTITGFTEQIWLNGTRQTNGLDYFKTNICPTCTGFYQDPGYNFSLYNSQSDLIGLFNITPSSIIPSNYLLDVFGNVITDVYGNPIITN